jgi:hypothetical protein
MTKLSEEQVQAWDWGYAKGYSEGYNNSVSDLIGWLLDEKYPDAAQALRYALSPEGIAEQNDRIRELYGSLQKMAAESRNR